MKHDVPIAHNLDDVGWSNDVDVTLSYEHAQYLPSLDGLNSTSILNHKHAQSVT